MKKHVPAMIKIIAFTVTAAAAGFTAVDLSAVDDLAENINKENLSASAKKMAMPDELSGRNSDAVHAAMSGEAGEFAEEVMSGESGDIADQAGDEEMAGLPVTASRQLSSEAAVPSAEQPAGGSFNGYADPGAVISLGYAEPGTGESTVHAGSPSSLQSSGNTAASDAGKNTSPLYSADYLSPEYYYGKTITIGGYSAALVPYGGQPAIDAEGKCAAEAYERMTLTDHASQGFRAIRTSSVAYIGSQKFVKVAQYNNGTNTGDCILLDDGTDYANANDPGLCMYTCNGADGKSVTVTFWIPSN